MTRVYREAEYCVQPWKNGRGSTREIYRIDEGHEWVFRVSSADVSESGPFSEYAGFDRTIVNLGPGLLSLRGPMSGQRSLELHDVHHFDGAESMVCEVSQPSRDLNVFCKRGQYFASVIVRPLNRPEFVPVPATSGLLVVVCSGSLVVHDNQRREFYLQKGDSIVREPSDAMNSDRWMLASASDELCFYVTVAFHRARKDL